MRGGAVRRNLSLAVFVVNLGAAATAPTPIQTIAIDTGPVIVSSTLAFISDDLIAIGRYPGSQGTLSATIATVSWRDGKLAKVHEKSLSLDRAAIVGGLYPVADEAILSELKITH